MTKIFIIHGAYGNPDENWFPWLRKELEKLGNTVFVPKFPTPEHQTLENWKKTFEIYKYQIDQDTVFVAHSLGPAFVLSILESINIQIKACFFVSGFIDYLDNEKFDEINKTFIKKEFDWETINKNCKQFFIFHSDNDPYVSLERSHELAEKLNTEITIINNAGHFNEKSGYTEFELLLEEIKKCLT